MLGYVQPSNGWGYAWVAYLAIVMLFFLSVWGYKLWKDIRTRRAESKEGER